MSAYDLKDTVEQLSTKATELVSPEEMLVLAQDAGFPINLCRAGLIEYGNYVTELVVRRMVMNAQMTFLACYGYYTYSFEESYAVADPSDSDGYYLTGNNLEDVVAAAYKWIQGVIAP